MPANSERRVATSLFARHLEFLSGIAIEAVGINCRNVAAEAFGRPLALRFSQTGPGRANCQSDHRNDIKAAVNDWRQLHKPAALAQCMPALHCVEQYVIQSTHRVAAAPRSREDRV